MKKDRESYLADRIKNWPEERVNQFQQDFLRWYDAEKRLLPWRENNDPYRVWISEIMLQQTRVDTVIPYFHRFMDWFPTIEELAQAPEEKLLKAWEGLGYYSRVRNIQKAAIQLVEEHNGKMPKDVEAISKLKGIGPYTTGAIASIAFDLPEPAIDGNVMRVFSRLFCIGEDISKVSSRKTFDFVVRHVISTEDPSSFNQGIMDLGSGVCTPTSPKCEECPIKNYCQSYAEGTMLEFPVKTKKIKTKPVYYLAQVLENEQHEFYIEKRSADGLLGNLWTFPLVEVSSKEYQEIKDSWLHFEEQQKNQLALDLVSEDECSLDVWLHKNKQDTDVVWQKQPVGEITHIFSHLKWHVLIHYGFTSTISEKMKDAEGIWVKKEAFNHYPFPKPQQKIVEVLSQKNYL